MSEPIKLLTISEYNEIAFAIKHIQNQLELQSQKDAEFQARIKHIETRLDLHGVEQAE